MLTHELFTHTSINEGFHIDNVLENTKSDLPPKLFSQYLCLHLHLTHELIDHHFKNTFLSSLLVLIYCVQWIKIHLIPGRH